ncbi:transcriptional regulator, BlaI/MecI/CopY family protein [Enterococcus gallinarum]|uniref:transcriptional regulator, BlaI/MecI/CopY family protein n=1 Tax=Enterococcus gallinarum TaxID=1353 RepID=UPI0012E1D0F4|nr:transcriptional regulator, BlaI/MecI/CopY family protein [Enterococcus gallinarum]MUN90466.1 transcriptional regulator, BlaI/MecI/CopY family protein [Enterococcus gallinarum]
MANLTKKEFQVMLSFYEINKSTSKKELVEFKPSLNQNSTGIIISGLLKKIYIRVSKIIKTRTVLARAYKPNLSFADFLVNEYGLDKVTPLIKAYINKIDDPKQLQNLLNIIAVGKERLKSESKIGMTQSESFIKTS